MARPVALKYDEGNIKRLRGLDGIRAKPAMYLGELGNAMVFQAMKELIANSVDECFAGRNDYVFVHADTANNTYVVADKAEGIPVGLVPEDPSKPTGKKISMLTAIFTEIHTGGKFDDKAYKTSQGTHGVGGSATNAVSESFEVWTFREKKWHYQQFLKGKPKAAVKTVSFPADVKKILPYMPNRGTVIRFRPDQTVVSTNGGKAKAKLDINYTARAMRDMAMLNPGVELVLSSNGKTKTFVNRDGLVGLVKKRVAELDLETLGRPFVYTSETLSVALQWSSYPEDTGLDTYVNSGQTIDHGEHELGFRNALSKVLAPFKKKTDKFGPKDLYFGLLGIVNWKMSGAAFSGQTKSKLTSDVSGLLEKELVPPLTAFFAKNGSLARQVIRRAAAVKKSKDEFTKTLKTMSGAKRASKNKMPSSLVESPRATALTRELYIVEGDSAGGTAKKARNPSTQEVLKLTGKIANSARMKLHKLMESKAIQDILTCIGYNFDAHKAGEQVVHKLRVKGIYLLPDADVDGAHIRVLLLTLIHKLMPSLIADGKVHFIDAPLFSAYYKGVRHYGATLKEVEGKLPKGAKVQVMRSKGWGEISHEMLAEVAFNPETRHVVTVTPVKGKALQHFESLVGNDSLARKELLGL